MKHLDRLMFAQGGLCFFCEQPLPRVEASVEHLQAAANDGSNKDENCVACCKALNEILGCRSVKDKFQVILNQKGQFKCPVGANAVNLSDVETQDSSVAEPFERIVSNLRNRKTGKPARIKTLSSTIQAVLQNNVSEQEVAALIEQLKSAGLVSVSGDKVTYSL